MSDTKTYKVLRALDGDKSYAIGDTRELSAADAKHLLDLGVIEEAGGAKQEAAPVNKAEAAPVNKSEVLDSREAADLGVVHDAGPDKAVGSRRGRKAKA